MITLTGGVWYRTFVVDRLSGKSGNTYPGSIDLTTNHTFAGRSASRRMYHLYHELP